MNPFLSAFLSKRLLDRKDGHRELVLAAFRDHVRQDQMDRAELDRAAGDRLARLMNHARRHVPRFIRVLEFCVGNGRFSCCWGYFGVFLVIYGRETGTFSHFLA